MASDLLPLGDVAAMIGRTGPRAAESVLRTLRAASVPLKRFGRAWFVRRDHLDAYMDGQPSLLDAQAAAAIAALDARQATKARRRSFPRAGGLRAVS